MESEILCIGSELLHGDIVNTNARDISKALSEIGIDVHYQTVVGDNPVRMKESCNIAFKRADVVIFTGGLGPTQDDITKEAVAEYFNLPMVYDEESYKHLVERYSMFSKNMPENNLRQTYFPKGSIILKNDNGTANACILDLKGVNRKIAVLLPGPPHEMKPLLYEKVIPYLSQISNETIYFEKIGVTKLGESLAEEMCMDLIKTQKNPTIATFAKNGYVIFRITAKAENIEVAKKIISPVKDEILKRFGKNAFILENDEKISDYVAKLLIQKKITVSTAESCTGGMLASKLIEYSGISEVYKEGFITYTEESKENRLKVSEETIKKYGVVSENTAREMAYGVSYASGTDMGIGVTGYAGPSGGTEENPVGTVFACIYYKNKYYPMHFYYKAPRNTVRERCVNMILNNMRELLEDI